MRIFVLSAEMRLVLDNRAAGGHNLADADTIAFSCFFLSQFFVPFYAFLYSNLFCRGGEDKYLKSLPNIWNDDSRKGPDLFFQKGSFFHSCGKDMIGY